MVVMDEAFDMWTRGKTSHDYALNFPQWWAADLESMVAKDYNHPSVIMYSIGNEIVEVGTPQAPDWPGKWPSIFGPWTVLGSSPTG
jgi:beta-galactosidase